MCHRAEYGPRFFVFREEKASEVLRVDPKKLNSYVGVVNQPPPKCSSVKKWLLHINYAPGYARSRKKNQCAGSSPDARAAPIPPTVSSVGAARMTACAPR